MRHNASRFDIKRAQVDIKWSVCNETRQSLWKLADEGCGMGARGYNGDMRKNSLVSNPTYSRPSSGALLFVRCGRKQAADALMGSRLASGLVAMHGCKERVKRRAGRLMSLVVAGFLAFVLLFALMPAAGLSAAPESAYAGTYEGGVILRNETRIEQLTNEYEDVQARVAETQARIDELAAQIPAQQERADQAIKLRYKTQNDSLAMLDVLFASTSLDEFLKQTEYIQRVSKANLVEINRLHSLKAEVDSLKAQIDEEAAQAREALMVEQNARAARQIAGVNKSRGQALSEGGEASVGVAFDGGEQPEDYREAATTNTAPLNDGADWYASRDDFVAHWAERLDAYLAGSALAGQGENFAKAAWKYNIDPRWSAAISNTESSKAAECIRPHNAWGWGAADEDPAGLALTWDSWEEAIDAHAKGLSEGYGYTISLHGARAYCPNTWQSWYNKTLAEMSRI